MKFTARPIDSMYFAYVFSYLERTHSFKPTAREVPWDTFVLRIW